MIDGVPVVHEGVTVMAASNRPDIIDSACSDRVAASTGSSWRLYQMMFRVRLLAIHTKADALEGR